ncbi:Uncharacterised protein [Raoultella terrigena]|nr:Uncharacterised protein [Raoultella terrigena]
MIIIRTILQKRNNVIQTYILCPFLSCYKIE